MTNRKHFLSNSFSKEFIFASRTFKIHLYFKTLNYLRCKRETKINV